MKRLFDCVMAFVALSILALPMGLLALLTWFMLGENPFFVQKRVGKQKKIFQLFKFKTMKNMKTSDGRDLPDEIRLTNFGKRIRASSLDELPQLLNVLLGSMSLVGPRPLLPEYLGYYTSREEKRHEMRPGLTGWAQINGRNATTWEKRLEMDAWYIENWSFLLDLKILFRTVVKVLKRENAGVSMQSLIEARRDIRTETLRLN